MAKTAQPRLIFYDRQHCYWRPKDEPPRFVQVLRWRLRDGKIMVEVKEVERSLNGVALVPEEELYEVV